MQIQKIIIKNLHFKEFNIKKTKSAYVTVSKSLNQKNKKNKIKKCKQDNIRK